MWDRTSERLLGSSFDVALPSAGTAGVSTCTGSRSSSSSIPIGLKYCFENRGRTRDRKIRGKGTALRHHTLQTHVGGRVVYHKGLTDNERNCVHVENGTKKASDLTIKLEWVQDRSGSIGKDM